MQEQEWFFYVHHTIVMFASRYAILKVVVLSNDYLWSYIQLTVLSWVHDIDNITWDWNTSSAEYYGNNLPLFCIKIFTEIMWVTKRDWINVAWNLLNIIMENVLI